MTGISQLRMFVVFSQVLPAILALIVGAFAYTAVKRDRLTWAITVGLTGAALGATRLVGENVANLVNLALEVGALVVLVSARDLRRADGAPRCCWSRPPSPTGRSRRCASRRSPSRSRSARS